MWTLHETAEADVDDTWTEVGVFSYQSDEVPLSLVCQVWCPSDGAGAFEVVFLARSSIRTEVPNAGWVRDARVGNIEPIDDTDPNDLNTEPATLEREQWAYDDLRVMAKRTDGSSTAQTIYARANANIES